MSKRQAKYIVTVVCSDRSTQQLDILSPLIDLNSFHLLYGRSVGRQPDEVRASGDIYLYPELVPADFVEGDNCNPGIVGRIASYIHDGETQSVLMLPANHADYKRHWDFFGLSPESFDRFHRNIVNLTFVVSTGSRTSGFPRRFRFYMGTFPLVRDDNVIKSFSTLLCKVSSPHKSVRFVTHCEKSHLLSLHGTSTTMLLQLFDTGDTFTYSGQEYRIENSCFESNTHLNYSMRYDRTIPPFTWPFFSAASLYLPFAFKDLGALSLLLYAASSDNKPPLLVVLNYVTKSSGNLRLTNESGSHYCDVLVFVGDGYLHVLPECADQILDAFVDTGRSGMIALVQSIVEQHHTKSLSDPPAAATAATTSTTTGKRKAVAFAE